MQQYTSTITASVTGNVTGVSLTPGAVFDADMVVGHQDGQPLTLGQALGPALLGACTPVAAESSATPKPRRVAPLAAPAETPAQDLKE